MKKEYATLLRASIPMAVAILGGLYLRNNPNISNYNPKTMATQNYTLTDADQDGDVDVVDFKTKKGNRKIFVAKDTVNYIKEEDKFFDMYGFAKELPIDIQNTATKTMYQGQNHSLLEKKLDEFQ